MRYSVQEISDKIGARVIGDPKKMIDKPSRIEEATQGSITFYNNEKYFKYLDHCKATAIVLQKNHSLTLQEEKTYLIVDEVSVVLPKLLGLFSHAENQHKGVHPTSIVGQNSEIESSTSIGAHTVIGDRVKIGENCQIDAQVFIADNVTIGNNVVLKPGVKIYHNCSIGNDVMIHSNSVIGSDGFGFSPDANGHFQKIPQVGNVIIEDRVEIGANCAIDRASMGTTRICQGVKLDNLIHIAHSVEIGANTVMAAQVGVAGSTKLGPYCMVGGQVGIVGHLDIAGHTQMQAQSGMIKSVKKENTKWYGYPAIEYNNYLRSFASFKNLPSTLEEIRSLKNRLKELEESTKESWKGNKQ